LIALIINAHPLGSGPLERSFENKCSLETRVRQEQFDRLVID